MPAELSRRSILKLLGTTALPAINRPIQPASPADAPSVTWSRTYAPAQKDRERRRGVTRAVVPIRDGIVLAGVRGAIESRGWLASVDTAGRLRWQHSIGAVQSYLAAGTPTPDGDAIFAGETNRPPSESTDQSYSDPWVVRVTPDGTVRWNRTYQPEAVRGSITAMTPTSTGYALAGTRGTDSDEYPWVASIDEHGTRQWRWQAPTDGHAGQATAITTIGTDLIVAGHDTAPETDTGTARPTGAWVRRLTPPGAEIWHHRFPTDQPNSSVLALAPAANGVVAAGHRQAAPGRDRAAWLCAVDEQGQTRWQHTYPRDAATRVADLTRHADGFVLAGTRDHPASDTRTAWLLRVGPSGSPQWETTAPSNDDTRVFTIRSTPGAGLLVGGDQSASSGILTWLASFGGNTTPQADTVTLPRIPDWIAPLLGGLGLGTLLGAIGMRQANRTDSDEAS